MFTFQEILEKVKDAQKTSKDEEVDIHLQLLDDGQWFFYTGSIPQDTRGYWSSTSMAVDEDEYGRSQTALVLISGLEICENDELADKIDRLLDATEKELAILYSSA